MRRFFGALWPIVQTSFAAGLAWYLTRDVLGQAAPFFAPIAAAVCLWATNVVGAQLAVDLMIGVALGIGLGTAVSALLGTGPIAMAAVVLFSLCTVVVFGRSFMPQ
ncbi:MAG: aromatic acid exporter family protein, partial [Mycobacterium sp.]